jgi:hypothetical protein
MGLVRVRIQKAQGYLLDIYTHKVPYHKSSPIPSVTPDCAAGARPASNQDTESQTRHTAYASTDVHSNVRQSS